MRDRFEVWIESSSSISKIYSSGYTLVLMDSCFIVEYSDIIELLASENNVTATGRIPAVCDFTRYEVKSIGPRTGGKPWKALKKAEKLNLCILRTGFIEYGEPTDKLLEFREYVKAFKKSYAGLPGRSNNEDLALYVTTLYLRDSDVKVEVATVDRALRKALEEADVTVHVEPWTHKHDYYKIINKR
jgi:hypothetical protein